MSVESPADGRVVDIASTNGVRLRGLLCPAEGGDGGRYPQAVVYLHGFPDMSVHPLRPSFASRFPRKLAEVIREAHPDWAFLCCNANGIPGSSGTFEGKTLRQEVDDCLSTVQHIRDHVLTPGGALTRRIHVVGLSTGAIVASLVSGTNPPDATITVVAGLLDLAAGVLLDFDCQQIEDFQRNGHCFKQFFLPRDCGRSSGGEWWQLNSSPDKTAANTERTVGEEGCLTPSGDTAEDKVLWRLNRAYYDDFFRLSIPQAVEQYTGPLLVVHGEADRSVPLQCGEALFRTAATPHKQWLCILGGNHLLSNTKHFNKFVRGFRDFLSRYAR